MYWLMRTHRRRLDDFTAERLLAGAVSPDDAPPGFGGASRLIGDARAHFAPAEAGNEAVVAAMVAAIQPATAPSITHRRKPVLAKILSAKVAAAAAVLALSATGAAAATDNLPDAAQNGLAKAASHVGINLPNSDGSHGKGADISSKAKSKDTTGVEKGADVSKTASNGKSRAGDDHPTSADHPAGAPSDTPNEGDTGTANDASVAGTASAGHHPTSTDHPTGRP